MKDEIKIVRIKFFTMILLVLVLCLITSCTKQQKEIEIYSFRGSNDSIMINNGLIIAANDFEKFIGGDLTFKGEEPSDVKYYVTKFYYYKDGVETTILSNVQSIEGSTNGSNISPDTGSSSSKDLFYDNELELIKKSLNFSVSGIYMNGDNFEYTLVLDVKKAY